MGDKSLALYNEALKVFPGGVNSPVRGAVKPYPFFVERAEGAFIYTVDGARLVDLVLGYGPLILGHKPRPVLEAVRRQLERGWLYGAPAEVELRLAKKILSYTKPRGMVRFVNSGTEATLTAIRIARGYTGRRYIVKFDGCYHGANDYLLVAAGSAASHYGVPNSLGILEEAARYTLVARYNDEDSLDRIMKSMGSEVAAIIVEPVIANMGVIPPKPGFLKHLRETADRHGALLIMDEVVTGFRLGLGGAQEYYGVRGDLVVLGKVIGGGMPIGAVAGPPDIMEQLTPKGKVFNAGTFNAHPVSMAAGLATLEFLETHSESVYTSLSSSAEAIEGVIGALLSDRGVDFVINRVESLLQVFFTGRDVVTPEDARSSNRALYERFHEELLRRGVFIAPSQFEAVFTSYAHDKEALGIIEEAVKEAVAAVDWS